MQFTIQCPGWGGRTVSQTLLSRSTSLFHMPRSNRQTYFSVHAPRDPPQSGITNHIPCCLKKREKRGVDLDLLELPFSQAPPPQVPRNPALFTLRSYTWEILTQNNTGQLPTSADAIQGSKRSSIQLRIPAMSSRMHKTCE